MNKKELQYRAGILNEDYHTLAKGEYTEHSQIESGKVDIEISDLRRRAGIMNEDDGSSFLESTKKKLLDVLRVFYTGHDVPNDALVARLRSAFSDLGQVPGDEYEEAKEKILRVARALAHKENIERSVLSLKLKSAIEDLDGNGMLEAIVGECPAAALEIKAAAAKDIREELSELAKFMRFIPDELKDKFDDRLDSISHHLEDIEEQL